VKRFAISLLYAITGYVAAALVGYFLVQWLSANSHDRSVEAAMTSVFVLGPAGAILGFIVGMIRHRERPSPAGGAPSGSPGA
jgi:F0F1-type ATP synthase membrane subunit c/vacuolar-type H+-ATPase subunit K